MKIWISTEQCPDHLRHLSLEWIPIYGYDPNKAEFLIWDKIFYMWRRIPCYLCEGEGA